MNQRFSQKVYLGLKQLKSKQRGLTTRIYSVDLNLSQSGGFPETKKEEFKHRFNTEKAKSLEAQKPKQAVLGRVRLDVGKTKTLSASEPNLKPRKKKSKPTLRIKSTRCALPKAFSNKS